MALGSRSETAGVVESIPSLPIHSSVLFVLIAGLFLAALVLRARQMAVRSHRTPGLTLRQARAARRRAQRRVQRRRGQAEGAGKQTISNAGVTSLAREGTMSQNTQQHAAPTAAAGDRQFRIHWGRTLLTLTAAAALLLGISTAVVAGFTALAWSVPLVCAGVLVLSMVGLQINAAARRRRKRRQRVERAMMEAMESRVEPPNRVGAGQPSGVQAGPRASGAVKPSPFDALTSDSEGQGGPDSLMTVDEDGLPVSAERLFGTEAPKANPEEAGLFDQSTVSRVPAWEPREVPHPKYLVADKVERPEPEPIESPQAPAPSADTKLKQPAAPAAQERVEPEVTGEGTSIDLDTVLKRRRA